MMTRLVRDGVVATARRRLRIASVLAAALYISTAKATGATLREFDEQPRLGPCTKDNRCQNYGTCQLNSGVCSCPVGFSGPLCDVMLWPACRITLDPLPIDLPPTMRCYLDAGPKNCECHRQCREQPSADPYSDYNACFERTTVSKENQLSTFPEEAELGVAYYKSAFDGFMRTQTTRDDAVFRGDAPRYKESEAPLSSCPRNCSLNGYCSARGDCMCYYGYGGSFCAEPQADSCFNDCSGRGRCVRGYCSCEPGRFGIDCSVDLAAVKGWRDLTVFPSPADAERMEPYGGPYPPEWKAMRARPDEGAKIFVYELPSWLNLDSETDINRPAGQWNSLDRGIYSVYISMLEQLLRDTGGARTLNPWEANIFFVPHLPYGFTTNGGPGEKLADRAARFVRAVWPFWDRFGGADHVFFAVQDLGECVYHYDRLGGRLPEFLRRAIWMTHWGADHAIRAWRSERTAEEFYPERCFQNEHYMVVPPALKEISQTAEDTYGKPFLEKDTLFFFAGNIDFRWTAYSLGVRQRLFIGTKHKPGFDMNNEYVNSGEHGHRPYREAVRRSIFCLAPAGGGWGQRLIDALAMRCIPVVVMDDVRQPFDDVLPYNEFALRVTMDELDDIEAVLRAVPPREIERLLRGAEKYHNFFFWNPGGLAYNTTIKALQMRAQNLLGAF